MRLALTIGRRELEECGLHYAGGWKPQTVGHVGAKYGNRLTQLNRLVLWNSDAAQESESFAELLNSWRTGMASPVAVASQPQRRLFGNFVGFLKGETASNDSQRFAA